MNVLILSENKNIAETIITNLEQKNWGKFAIRTINTDIFTEESISLFTQIKKEVDHTDAVIIFESIVMKAPLLLGNLLSKKLPIVLLVDSKEKKGDYSWLSKYKNLNIVEYENQKTASRLNKVLLGIREGVNKKFILILSPEIQKYISWSSGNGKTHKASIIRHAIIETMNKDKEWVAYLGSNLNY